MGRCGRLLVFDHGVHIQNAALLSTHVTPLQHL